MSLNVALVVIVGLFFFVVALGSQHAFCLERSRPRAQPQLFTSRPRTTLAPHERSGTSNGAHKAVAEIPDSGSSSPHPAPRRSDEARRTSATDLR